MSVIQTTLKNTLFPFILSLLFVSSTLAAPSSDFQAPDDMLKVNTIKMLRSINDNRAAIKQHPDKLKSLVEEIIMPHLDFIAASKMVMGKYWRNSNIDQKKKFILEFRTLLLRFYSSALSEYLIGRDKNLAEDLIRYFPIKLNDGETAITVRAEIKTDSGQPIPLRYRVHLTKKGWKIYDISVEGISMITTYKNNFATQFKTQGVDALIASLVEKNKQMLAKNDK